VVVLLVVVIILWCGRIIRSAAAIIGIRVRLNVLVGGYSIYIMPAAVLPVPVMKMLIGPITSRVVLPRTAATA
jgi:hypothetical protein